MGRSRSPGSCAAALRAHSSSPHCLLRAGFLGAVVVLSATGLLAPAAYIALLAGSSLLASWGNAGEYTMLAELGGPEGRLAANALASAQVSLATIVGPVLAGLLLTRVAPGWLLAFDAASFAFLGGQAWRAHTEARAAEQPIDTKAAESGFRLLRRADLLGLIVLTWLFFFLYGPVEDALPVYVAHDLHARAGLLGAYWTSFGVGALASTLLTGMLRSRNSRLVTLSIVAGWGACLVPFAFAPLGVTLVCFALGAHDKQRLVVSCVFEENRGVAAPRYRFLDRWLVPHPIEAVYDVMSDVYAYPTWWGDVWDSTSGHAGPPAPGTRTQVVAHGYLPYRLRYEFECVAVDRPYRIDSVLHGDFEGTAALSFEAVDGGTTVELDFRPSVNKRGVRQLTPLLRPLFRSNHAWAMRRGEKRINERLQK